VITITGTSDGNEVHGQVAERQLGGSPALPHSVEEVIAHERRVGGEPPRVDRIPAGAGA
jgi:hypothetical protein